MVWSSSDSSVSEIEHCVAGAPIVFSRRAYSALRMALIECDAPELDLDFLSRKSLNRIKSNRIKLNGALTVGTWQRAYLALLFMQRFGSFTTLAAMRRAASRPTAMTSRGRGHPRRCSE
jgi:hypothetical protein